jgi:hypothetical protein
MTPLKTFEEILIEKIQKGEVTIIPVDQQKLKKFQDYMAACRCEYNLKSIQSQISAANMIITT